MPARSGSPHGVRGTVQFLASPVSGVAAAGRDCPVTGVVGRTPASTSVAAVSRRKRCLTAALLTLFDDDLRVRPRMFLARVDVRARPAEGDGGDAGGIDRTCRPRSILGD